MASYHLAVKTVKRSAGRSATAAAAYRSGSVIACEREGRVHDYSAKRGVAETFIVAPADAPAWAQDRAALWNAAEARETRRNSVTAREWELALPSEISDAERSAIARDFAQALVDRYDVAADVAIHAPHREGDQRNHHAHVLTTTRALGAEGLGAKTRILDAAQTGGAEIEEMRALWGQLQNRALERAGMEERVDHRSLEVQRAVALDRGDALSAEELDRAPEVKLGPAANAIERREMAASAREGRDYVPVTERGAKVHTARQARALFAEMRERLEIARDVYGIARDQGEGRVSAGLAALRAAVGKDGIGGELGEGGSAGDLLDRLTTILGKGEGDGRAQSQKGINERLATLIGKERHAREQRDIGEEHSKERSRDIGLERDEGIGL
ncbi:MAG: molybdopterin-guanine dinucleotide biosynthesis protein MobA [Paracoccus sp.]|nr:molybdopterin-guanine dinucleotide biosynthesis protein MobA [Paracoccus sp. (in: a-proteobacteria)]|tara:strand:+ start:173 stop:1333 length:1161 start_codon:yes stop_codon:yes gene_type:complete